MKTKKLSPAALALAFALFLGSVLETTPSSAGFQWLPPAPEKEVQKEAPPAQPVPDIQPVQPAPAMQPVVAPSPVPVTQPVPTVPELKTPEINIGSQGVTIPQTESVTPPLTVFEPGGQVSLFAPGHVFTPPPAEPELPADNKVLGFAESVPLIVALEQVLPKDVQANLAQDVPPETVVSWKGGADWRTVLAGMLKPANLTSREEGGKVYITTGASLGILPRMEAEVLAIKPQQIEISAAPVAKDAEPQPIDLTQPPPPPPPPSPAPTQDASTAPSLPPSPSLSIPPADELSKNPPSDNGFKLIPASPPVPAEAPIPLTKEASAPIVIPEPVPLASYGDAVEVWEGNKGETLREVLRKWASREKVDLSWESEYDYPLQAAISFTGTFEEAVRLLLVGLQNASPQPYGDLHRNQVVGQTVLVIKARSNKTAH